MRIFRQRGNRKEQLWSGDRWFRALCNGIIRFRGFRGQYVIGRGEETDSKKCTRLRAVWYKLQCTVYCSYYVLLLLTFGSAAVNIGENIAHSMMWTVNREHGFHASGQSHLKRKYIYAYVHTYLERYLSRFRRLKNGIFLCIDASWRDGSLDFGARGRKRSRFDRWKTWKTASAFANNESGRCDHHFAIYNINII